MSATGPRAMYQVQQAAYTARNNFVLKPTDSTPETPPTHPPIDVEGICQLKKDVVANLPKVCCHCESEYPPGSIIERPEGSIIAYCKLKGACGKSRVLFAGIELSVPVYEKICRFQKPASDEAERQYTHNELAAVRADVFRLHGIVAGDVICELCGKRYDQHEDAAVIGRADQNGWVERRRSLVPLPADWPKVGSNNVWF